jgi:hypothetical protein
MKTKKTTKKPTVPAAMRPHPKPTINAEMVDQLFEQTIANMMALQVVWEKISLKEKLK